MVANFSDETLTVPISTILGITEEVSEQVLDRINSKDRIHKQMPPKPPRQKKDESLYHKLLQCKLDHLNVEDMQPIEPVLQNFSHLFHDEESNSFKSTNVIEHKFP
jgi:hypothetical protein